MVSNLGESCGLLAGPGQGAFLDERADAFARIHIVEAASRLDKYAEMIDCSVKSWNGATLIETISSSTSINRATTLWGCS
jgi:hypothetical protein